LKIVISGGTGFVGKALISHLIEDKHQIVVLTRNSDRFDNPNPRLVEAVRWDGKTVNSWSEKIAEADTIINLAGEPIGIKRWNDLAKQLILNSRVESTKAIVKALSASNKPPRVFLNASASSYYGDMARDDADESQGRGNGFLSETCERWENQAKLAESSGVRVVMLRFGIVLDKNGGALAKMMLPFKIFAGGPPGSGKQWVSWIHREDAVRAIVSIIYNDDIRGPVNVTSPEPVSMRDFCSTLAKTLGRHSWAAVPDFVLKTMLGEMSEMLLTGQRAIPRKLQGHGFKFKYPELKQALGVIFNGINEIAPG
jgi:uncharacterized protein (TIGR01777 family)